MRMALSLSSRQLGQSTPPFVIAEMSGNHNHSLERALAIVDAAATSGAHALKIQTYTADTMTIDLNEREFHISDPKNLWTGRSLYDLYGQACTPWEWHQPIFDRARVLLPTGRDPLILGTLTCWSRTVRSYCPSSDRRRSRRPWRSGHRPRTCAGRPR